MARRQAISSGKIHKFITGIGLNYKGSKRNIEFEVVRVDNSAQIVILSILSPSEFFGDELRVKFRTLRRGPFFKTDTTASLEESKVKNMAKTLTHNELKNNLTQREYRYYLTSMGRFTPTWVHISDVKHGDTVAHQGKIMTVSRNDISYSDFMGRSLFGDSYRLGRKPVIKFKLDSLVGFDGLSESKSTTLLKESLSGVETLAALQGIVDDHQAEKIDGVLVDVQTANLIVQIYRGLEARKPSTAQKFLNSGIKKMADIAWKAATR